MSLLRICILFFCFAFVLTGSAQDKSKAIALKSILQSIEKQHQIYFNYIEQEITTFKIVPPKKQLSLKDKIQYLENKTKLSFENIDNKFINVYQKTVALKPICGFVYSKEDNLPLENSNVQFVDGAFTTTDKNGYFEIQKGKSTLLIIHYLGFSTKKIPFPYPENEQCLKIYLEPEIAALEIVEANHFLTSGISKGSNGTFIIKPKKFGLLPGLIEPDVLQTMQQIPGINSADESVSSINVRGGTHDQNLFLWNGIRMYQTGHFFGLISAFNPNLAHTISISKNGSSAFYGESVSSVVNISSMPSQFEENSFSAGVNMIAADVYSKFNLNKKGFLEIAARRSLTDLVKTPTYADYFDKAFQNTNITNFSNTQNTAYSSDDKFNFYDISLKYFQKIGQKDQLALDLITISDQLKVFQLKNTTAIAASESNILYQKNYGGNLSWKRNWNAKNVSTLNVYSSSYELDAENNKSLNNQDIKQENHVLDSGIKLENNHIITSKLTLNNGYQYNEIGITNLDQVSSPSFYRKTKDVLRTHALVAEGKFSDTLSRIHINAGVRLNYIEKFNKYILEPRLQFNYGLTKGLNLELLGELKSQNSLQVIDLQKDYLGIEKRRWIMANDASIPIQRSKQASINLSFTKNNWFLSLENFYKKVNGINSSSQGFQNQLEFEKINGNYEVMGAEILVQKKINRFLSWISYTYNNNTYAFTGIAQHRFSNNFELDHVVSWAGIYEHEHLKIALGSKWYSGRPETTPSSNIINTSNPSNPTIDYNSPNNKKLDPFFQVNFSTTYKWKAAKGIQYKLGCSILNVLNRKNEISEYYRISSTSNSIEDVKIYSLRRTPNLSFRITF